MLGVILTALLTLLFAVPTTNAEGSTAEWSGQSITYEYHQYFKASEPAKANQIPGVPQDSTYYVFVEQISERPLQQKAHVIYFTTGIDPPTATSANYAVYDYSATKTFSNATGQMSIVITPQGEGDAYASGCAVEGIGWIVCPISVFLAGAMDWVFDVLTSFIAVQPPTVGDSNSDLYIAWNVMRSFANVAFIIAFIVIIYSQLTGAGITNYGLKKLLPRLIIAAVLVNVSFYICAIALDISNILGYSLQDIFIQIRQDVFNIDNETWAWSGGNSDWTAITTFVLSGGTAATIGILVATGGSITSAIFLILPLLLGLLLTVLFVLLILAARQAIIIILIVIAPLAFVANLLPNTEKWFEKWRELFMTMLIFFPAFSVVFGGSQLAGAIILQNASSIVMVVLGLAVQIAPLVITPLILKLSGGLLSRIGGIINDPRKGLLDRTRKWTGDRAEMRKQLAMGNPNLKPYNFARRAARSLTYGNRRVERLTEEGKAGFEQYALNRDYTSRRGQQIATNTANNKLAAENTQKDFDQAMHEARAGDQSGLERLRMVGDPTIRERVQARVEGVTVEDLRITNNRAYNRFASEAVSRASGLDQGSRTIANATAAAQIVQQQRFADAIEKSKDLQIKAGGIDPKGAERALANAFTAISKAQDEAVQNANSILSHYNLGDDVVNNIAIGIPDPKVTFEVSEDIKLAAAKQIAGGGNTVEIMRLLENMEINTSDDNQDYRQLIADSLMANSYKPKFLGAGDIANIKQGIIPPSGSRLEKYIIQAVDADKFGSAELLVTQDRDYLKAVSSVLNDPTARAQMSTDSLDLIRESIQTIKDNPDYKGRVGERAKVIESIDRTLNP